MDMELSIRALLLMFNPLSQLSVENSKRLGLEIIFPNYLVMLMGLITKSRSCVDVYIWNGSQVEQA